jgi:spore germination protein KA
MLRFIGYGITVFGPAIYIALTAFHQELIPTTLLLTIANARGNALSRLPETFIMVFAFEVLREAGIRLPRPVWAGHQHRGRAGHGRRSRVGRIGGARRW